jgi:DNA-binding GntR family transcriptional regulator
LVAERALQRDAQHARACVRVPILGVDDVEDIWRIRLALEGEAAALAAERATAADLAKIEAAAKAAIESHDTGRTVAFLSANQRFHFAVYAAAHSELLVAMIETLWLQIGPVLGEVAQLQPDLKDVRLDWHERLVEAVRAREPEEARTALHADIEKATDVFGILGEQEQQKTIRRA